VAFLREAATGQLRWAGKLLQTRSSDDVRAPMFDYDAADRCFQCALWCADQSKSWPVRANVLAEIARKETYLGNLDNALTLIEFAQGPADRVPATGRAMLWTMRARLLGLTGRQDEVRAEADRADAHFANRDLPNDPLWLVYYDKAEHQGSPLGDRPSLTPSPRRPTRCHSWRCLARQRSHG
jgi:hypothetical protein